MDLFTQPWCVWQVMGGTNWVRNVLLTTALFCGPLLVTFSFLNTVAIVYHSTAALPFGTICIIILIWALITLPLTVFGGIAGKNVKVCTHLLALCASCSNCILARCLAPAQVYMCCKQVVGYEMSSLFCCMLEHFFCYNVAHCMQFTQTNTKKVNFSLPDSVVRSFE